MEYPGNWIDEIDYTASLIAGWARQLQRRWDDINVAIHNEIQCIDANKHYIGQVANLRAEDLEIDALVLVHRIKIEQSHCARLDARWRGQYMLTEIAHTPAN